MRSPTYLLHRHGLTLGLTLLFVLAMAAYALSYLPAREEYLRARYFRVLNRMGENIKGKAEAYEKRVTAMRREILYNVSLNKSGTPVSTPRHLPDSNRIKSVAATLRYTWNRQGLNSPAFERLNSAAGTPAGHLLSTAWLPMRQQVQLNYGFNEQLQLITTVGIKDVVGDLLRPDVFAHFLVLGPPSSGEKEALLPISRVYYSTFEAPAVVLGPQDAGKHFWLQDTTGILSARQGELSISGRSHQIFTQPIRLSGGVTWLLVGAVPTDSFRAQQRALPDSVLEVMLALILFGILALPYLKIVLMHARERLNYTDVVGCGLSLVFGTTFLVVLSMSPVAKYDIEPDLQHHQLTEIVGRADTRLRQELTCLALSAERAENGLLQDQAQQLLQKQEKPLRSLRASYHESARGGKPKEYFLPGLKLLPGQVLSSDWGRTWQPDDRLHWLDSAGEALVLIDSLPTRFNPSLLDRDFVRAGLLGQMWQLPAVLTPDSFCQGTPAASFRLASVVRYGRAGNKSAVFVRPSLLRFFSSGRFLNNAAVSAGTRATSPVPLNLYTTRLRTFASPVLPPGFSFCLIDAQGQVLFHSDSRLALSENLLQDAEPGSLLRTVMLTGQPAEGVVQYQGRPHRLYAQSWANLPLFLVAMIDLRPVRTHHMQALSFASTLLGMVALAHLLFLLLYIIILPRRHRMFDIVYQLRRLWARSEREMHYWKITAALAGGIVLLWLFSLFIKAPVLIFLLVTLPVHLFGYGFRILQLPEDATKASPRVFGLVAATLTVYGILAFYWTGPALSAEAQAPPDDWVPFATIVLFHTALFLLMRLVGYVSGRWKAPENKHGGRRSYKYFRRAYICMLLGWLVVLSIAPAIYCYHLAYQVERELQLHHDHLQLISQLRAAEDRAETEHLTPNERAAQTAYLSGFFGTKYYSSDSDAWEKLPSRAVRNFRQIVQWLHPGFDTLQQSGRSTLPFGDYATYWGTKKRDNDTRVWSYHARPDGSHDKLMSFVSDVAWGRHWYWPSAVTKGESWPHYLPRTLRQLGMLALLLVVLYILLSLLARRVFNLDLLSLKNLMQQTALSPDLPLVAEPVAVHCYLINPTGGGLPDRYKANESVSCYRLVPATEDEASSENNKALLKKAVEEAKSADIYTLVLDHFDYRVHDTSMTRAKIELLEYLVTELPAAARLVVVSRVHPSLFADCGHSPQQCPRKDEHEVYWQQGDRLLDVLAGFVIAYEPFHPRRPLRPDVSWTADGQELTRDKSNFEDKLRKALDRTSFPAEGITGGVKAPSPSAETLNIREVKHYLLLRWYVRVECDALPFLAPLESELEQFLLASARSGRQPTEDDIILAIHRRAQLQLRQLWETLAPNERHLLYDLAQDGLVNGREPQLIYDLLHRGLLVYDQLGLRIVNETFRTFILIGLPPSQALRIEKEAEQEADKVGSWRHRSFPVFLLLVAACLFIIVTQHGSLSQAEALLTTALSGALLLSRFFGLPTFGSAPLPNAATKSGENPVQ
ncbi:hypothetical protein [Hymenobacter fodinae]|uniref:Uncharacterized protein n=1 Tax=Hymenobacter fodinae TaxID=2510796 RepID=A0A4Z0NZJ4_9BACT|nr:hypothetical protein [Hymenobacter fodinae]TGE03839.1 hypothetical protein EU556_24850 [Hymenobacter fodinae]